ncbi:MAG: hypothetical protein AAFY55_14630 [Bacteroidota bacterium]
MPNQLRRLALGEKSDALEASHNLWCGLCHQHAYVSSAAVPAFPFLMDVLRQCDAELRTELLDIIAGFVVCTDHRHPEADGGVQRKLRALLQAELPYFRTLVGAEGSEGFAEWIVEDLEQRSASSH